MFVVKVFSNVPFMIGQLQLDENVVYSVEPYKAAVKWIRLMKDEGWITYRRFSYSAPGMVRVTISVEKAIELASLR